MQKITIMRSNDSDGADWYFESDIIHDNIVLLGKYWDYGQNNEWYETARDFIDTINSAEDYEGIYIEDFNGEVDGFNVIQIDEWVYDVADIASRYKVDQVWVAQLLGEVIGGGEYLDSDDAETLTDVLNHMNFGEFDCDTLRGYSQGDYVEIIYNKDVISDSTLEDIEDFLFGGYCDIHIEDGYDDYWAYIPDHLLWRVSKDTIIKVLQDYIGDVEDDAIVVDETGNGLSVGDADRFDENMSRMDRGSYDTRNYPPTYDLDTISQINESQDVVGRGQ